MITVQDLLTQVRVQIDEANNTDISDASVLQALNRAQTKIVRLATRKFAPMFRKEVLVSPDSTNLREAVLPDLAFGIIVNEVDCIKSGQAYRVEPADLSQLTEYDSSASATDIPLYYAQQGNRIKLYPRPKGATQLRVRYQVRPPDLVKPQGRVVNFDALAVTAELDSLGSDLTTSIASLFGFVNWIDGITGLVRATLQVSALDSTTNTITFKTASLDRTTVFGLAVSTALPTAAAQDDYLAIANGTCVPTLIQDYADYLIQYAVVELRRKNGEDTTADYAALKELEEDIKCMWSGREAARRVRKAGPYWGGKLPLIARYR